MADETLRLVKHVSCNYAIYKALGTYDEDTLYFIEDQHMLYKGDVLIGNVGGGNLEYTTGTPDPEEMTDGVTYITVTEDGQVIVYQKDSDTGEVEVVASSMSKEEIDELVKELVSEYATDEECLKDVEASETEEGNTTLTFTRVNGETTSVDIANNPCVWTYIDSSNKLVYTFEDAAEAMADSSVKTLTLEADIECTDPNGLLLEDGTEKTVELNGHNVTALCDNTEESAAAFRVWDGTLTIDGDGSVDGGSGCPSDVAVWAYSENAKVIINGGEYTTQKDKDDDGNSTIYGEAGAQIIINGGHFDNDSHDDTTGPKRYVLNIQNNTGSTITCYGGEYVDQNPADGDDKDTATGSTFLAEGYKVEESEEDNHIIYTVVEDN